MIRKLVWVLVPLLLATLFPAPPAEACGYGARRMALNWVLAGEKVEEGIALLREDGYASLDLMFTFRESYRNRLEKSEDPAGREELQRRLTRLEDAIERVGGQRYCLASRLFWHTDLQQALATAQAENKPILSLRMLGNLTEDFSCANSRFFRTTLYANQEISAYLRAHYVLHWESVRPAPRVTIDFGDGRVLERTVTGNSAHYVLNGEGRPLDVLPGLYGPAEFLRHLERGVRLANDHAAQPAGEEEAWLARYHAERVEEIRARWEAELRQAAPERLEAVLAAATAEVPSRANAPGRRDDPAPPAEAAGRLAVTKAKVEMPLVLDLAALNRSLRETAPGSAPGPAVVGTDRLEAATDEATWNRLARLRADSARLDEASRRLIVAQSPMAHPAMALAVTKALVESPTLRMLRNLEGSIALDTVRNEYQLHRRIHQWFAAGEPTADLAALNERVYAELFLTPSSDSWLGLLPPDTYSGLPNDGRAFRE